MATYGEARIQTPKNFAEIYFFKKLILTTNSMKNIQIAHILNPCVLGYQKMCDLSEKKVAHVAQKWFPNNTTNFFSQVSPLLKAAIHKEFIFEYK
jgi:hypothetical protein